MYMTAREREEVDPYVNLVYLYVYDRECGGRRLSLPVHAAGRRPLPPSDPLSEEIMVKLNGQIPSDE